MQSRQELETLGVHKLRDLARELGVKAPTTKRQSELINEILKIQSGELEAVKSKMGRPPKGRSNTFNKYDFIFEGASIVDMPYASIQKVETLEFKDNRCFYGINNGDTCLGIIRKSNDKYYFRNYKGAKNYVVIDKLKGNCKVGSLVEGSANAYSSNLLKSDNYEAYKFSNDNQQGETAAVIEFNEIEDMYEYVLNDSATNKIVTEIEANVVRAQKLRDQIFIHTEECEDVVESYNMLLDIKSLVDTLLSEGKSFVLYLIDVEYMYGILYTYFQIKGISADANAGQYFKELLSKLNNCQNAKVVLFEKTGSLRSSYLDIILNKYCKREIRIK